MTQTIGRFISIERQKSQELLGKIVRNQTFLSSHFPIVTVNPRAGQGFLQGEYINLQAFLYLLVAYEDRDEDVGKFLSTISMLFH